MRHFRPPVISFDLLDASNDFFSLSVQASDSFVTRAPIIDISARHTKDRFDENRREGMAVLYRWAGILISRRIRGSFRSAGRRGRPKV
jgi:hypothetical protein